MIFSALLNTKNDNNDAHNPNRSEMLRVLNWFGCSLAVTSDVHNNNQMCEEKRRRKQESVLSRTNSNIAELYARI